MLTLPLYYANLSSTNNSLPGPLKNRSENTREEKSHKKKKIFFSVVMNIFDKLFDMVYWHEKKILKLYFLIFKTKVEAVRYLWAWKICNYYYYFFFFVLAEILLYSENSMLRKEVFWIIQAVLVSDYFKYIHKYWINEWITLWHK